MPNSLIENADLLLFIDQLYLLPNYTLNLSNTMSNITNDSSILNGQQNSANLSLVTFYLYFTLVPLLSCLLLLRFYSRIMTVRSKLPTQLTIHLFLWILSCSCSVFYTTPLLASLLIQCELFYSMGL
jgi:hypothetical protein